MPQGVSRSRNSWAASFAFVLSVWESYANLLRKLAIVLFLAKCCGPAGNRQTILQSSGSSVLEFTIITTCAQAMAMSESRSLNGIEAFNDDRR